MKVSIKIFALRWQQGLWSWDGVSLHFLAFFTMMDLKYLSKLCMHVCVCDRVRERMRVFSFISSTGQIVNCPPPCHLLPSCQYARGKQWQGHKADTETTFFPLERVAPFYVSVCMCGWALQYCRAVVGPWHTIPVSGHEWGQSALSTALQPVQGLESAKFPNENTIVLLSVLPLNDRIDKCLQHVELNRKELSEAFKMGWFFDFSS